MAHSTITASIPHSCTVDNLRFRVKYHGRPERASEWYERVWNRVDARWGAKGAPETVRKLPTRYPLSLRMGSYRDMMVIPAGSSSITFAMGRNGSGKKDELCEGMLEFNPSKTYPSPQLEHLYELIDKGEHVELELVRWDFATDYPLERESMILLRDQRKYGVQLSESLTEYAGRRNAGGFVKVYDKAAERRADGEAVEGPITRVEVTVEEPRVELGRWWPRVVWLPDDADSVDDATLRLLVLAVRAGVSVEVALAGFSVNSRKKYRNALAGLVGELPCPDEYRACRNDALAWATFYGGRGRSLVMKG